MSHSTAATLRIPINMLCAIGAVIIWSTLAVVVTFCANVNPLFITGAALLIGGIIGLPWVRAWAMPVSLFVIGTFCMLTYHVIYFYALQLAEPVGVSLIHYLWPVLIVILAPIVVPHGRPSTRSLVAGGIGFIGAIISCNPHQLPSGSDWIGYGLALVSAFLWVGYSLVAKKYPNVQSASVGLFCIVSGVVCLALYKSVNPWPALRLSEMAAILYMGLGPMGGAFYLWDYAMKKANHEHVAILSYATPVLSTAFLALYLGLGMQWYIWVGAALVTVSMVMSQRST